MVDDFAIKVRLKVLIQVVHQIKQYLYICLLVFFLIFIAFFLVVIWLGKELLVVTLKKALIDVVDHSDF